MKTFDLKEKIIFSSDEHIKRHFLNAKVFHAAQICLKAGVEIPPHSEDCGVLLTVLEGKGVFTDIDKKFTLTKSQSIYLKKRRNKRYKSGSRFDSSWNSGQIIKL